MKTLIFAFISVIFIAGSISAQDIQFKFEKLYGGPNFDRGRTIALTNDGGYIFLGGTQSFGAGDFDILAIKTDAIGNVQWTKTYGGFSLDYTNQTIQDNENNFLIVGYTNSFGSGDLDFLLIKIDPVGNILWSKTVGGLYGDAAYSVVPTDDGSYIVYGFTKSYGHPPYIGDRMELYLIKVSSSGIVEWEKVLGTTETDWPGYNMVKTSDGGFALVAQVYTTTAPYSYDYMLGQTDSLGNFLWAKRYDGSDNDRVFGVKELAGEGFILVGNSASFGFGDNDILIVRTAVDGEVIWSKVIGGLGEDIARVVDVCSEGGFMVSGVTSSYGFGQQDAFLLKIDDQGNLEWFHTYGDIYNEEISFGYQALDGGFIIGGDMVTSSGLEPTAYLIKTDSLGESACEYTTVNPTVNNVSLSAIPIFLNNFAGGNVGSPTLQVSSAPLITYTLCELITEAENFEIEFNNLPVGYSLSQNYPNPFNPSTVISYQLPRGRFVKLILYDILGHEITTLVNGEKDAGYHQVEFDGSNLSSGIYFYRIQAGKFTDSKKFILVK